MKMMLKNGITLVGDQSGPTENGKQQFSPQSACLSSLHKNFADFHGITMLPVIRSVLSKAIKFWECIKKYKEMPITDYIIPILVFNRNERYIFVETFRNFKEKYATIHQWNDPKLLHIFLLIFKACACCRVYHVKVKAVETCAILKTIK
ncbi:hypothetical protein T05_7631 [Trichinella murrelli]|uniref:Uncharacterized protein n=1 Tax=Trichinella murrelli TaxID=144512 RepID=A0A0V0U912_9BILA|nr:hypothetical protein T05_7631 [Trichinella murrelli]